MKGALLDYIRATVGQAIKSASNIIYTNPPSLTSLPGNGLVTKDMLMGYVPPVTIPITYEVPVTAQTGLVINWQTDLIDGINTFADALGDNLPKPVHYFFDGVNTYTNGSVVPVIVRTSGLITTVTFDWGYSADCVIVF